MRGGLVKFFGFLTVLGLSLTVQAGVFDNEDLVYKNEHGTMTLKATAPCSSPTVLMLTTTERNSGIVYKAAVLQWSGKVTAACWTNGAEGVVIYGEDGNRASFMRSMFKLNDNYDPTIPSR